MIVAEAQGRGWCRGTCFRVGIRAQRLKNVWMMVEAWKLDDSKRTKPSKSIKSGKIPGFPSGDDARLKSNMCTQQLPRSKTNYPHVSNDFARRRSNSFDADNHVAILTILCAACRQ